MQFTNNPVMTTKKAVSQSVNAKSAKNKKAILTEEGIRSRAHEIYLERVNKGIHGTADHDWQKAIAELQGNN